MPLAKCQHPLYHSILKLFTHQYEIASLDNGAGFQRAKTFWQPAASRKTVNVLLALPNGFVKFYRASVFGFTAKAQRLVIIQNVSMAKSGVKECFISTAACCFSLIDVKWPADGTVVRELTGSCSSFKPRNTLF